MPSIHKGTMVNDILRVIFQAVSLSTLIELSTAQREWIDRERQGRHGTSLLIRSSRASEECRVVLANEEERTDTGYIGRSLTGLDGWATGGCEGRGWSHLVRSQGGACAPISRGESPSKWTRPWPITVDRCFPVGFQVLSAPLSRSCLAPSVSTV